MKYFETIKISGNRKAVLILNSLYLYRSFGRRIGLTAGFGRRKLMKRRRF